MLYLTNIIAMLYLYYILTIKYKTMKVIFVGNGYQLNSFADSGYVVIKGDDYIIYNQGTKDQNYQQALHCIYDKLF